MNETLTVQVLDGLEKLSCDILNLLLLARPLTRLESLINIIVQATILNILHNDVEVCLIVQHLINVDHRAELALLVQL